MNDPKAVVLAPTGRLDEESCGGLRHQLAAAFAVGVDKVTVDLSRVTYVDPTGLGVLAGAARHLEKQGGSLRLTQPSPIAEHGLRINGLEHLVAPSQPRHLTVVAS